MLISNKKGRYLIRYQARDRCGTKKGLWADVNSSQVEHMALRKRSSVVLDRIDVL